MKVLSCKIENDLFDEFKKQNNNVSKRLRELVTNDVRTHRNNAEKTSIPIVYRLTPIYEYKDISLRVDELIRIYFKDPNRNMEEPL